MTLGRAGAKLEELIFVPETKPSHALARYTNGESSLIALEENGNTISLPGTAVSIDLVPSEAPRYLIIRYDDGLAEIWRGLEDIRRLGILGANLQGHSLTREGSALTVWYADGHADVLDLEWLEQVTADDVSVEQLSALVCRGPLARFDASVLNDWLSGDEWNGCNGTRR